MAGRIRTTPVGGGSLVQGRVVARAGGRAGQGPYRQGVEPEALGRGTRCGRAACPALRVDGLRVGQPGPSLRCRRGPPVAESFQPARRCTWSWSRAVMVGEHSGRLSSWVRGHRPQGRGIVGRSPPDQLGAKSPPIRSMHAERLRQTTERHEVHASLLRLPFEAEGSFI